MTRGALRSLASPLAWTLYIALPVAGWGWLDGLPIGWLEAGAIALVWWAWAGSRQLPGMRVLAGLAIAKVALGALLVGGGFSARYYANDAWAPPVERSVEYGQDDLTRRDERLAFGGPGQPDLPLHFLNHLRFNFYRPEEPMRDLLPYSVIWEGFIRGGADGPSSATFYLAAAEGVRGELLIDQQRRIALGDAAERSVSATLPPGWHSLTIRAAAPYGSGRRIEAGEIVEGVRRPFDSRRVLIAPVGSAFLAIGGVARSLAHVIDVAMLSWLGALVVGRARNAARSLRAGRLLWLAAIVEALLFAFPYEKRAVVLSGGDDWLMYEHLARAIISDPLLRQPGLGAGQGAPFYFQPLYPYFVAVTHLVFGDGIFGVALVQRLLIPAAAVWAAAITRRLFGTTAGWVALIGGGLFLYVKAGRWSDVLLAEPLFAPMLVGWTWLLVRTATDAPSWPRLLLTGAIGGIATLTRTTLFLAWPLVLPAWAASLRTSRARSTTIVVAMMLAVVGTLSLRTWLVAGTFALAPSNGGVTLYVGNEPSPQVAPAPPAREAVYERLHLTFFTRAVAEYAFQRPVEFVGNLGRKALYSVGLFDLSGIQPTGIGVPGVSVLYVGMWCAALIGMVRLARSPARRSSALVWLPGLVALSHLAVMIAFLPNVYGDRQILPMYPLLIPYAAFVVEPVARWAHTSVARVAPTLLAVLTIAAFFPASPRSSDMVMLLILAAAILAITARRPPIAPRHWWLYLGYATAFLLLMLVRSAGAGDEIRIGRYLLLPLVAFALGQLAGDARAHRATVAALVIGPFFTREAADRFATSHAADPFLWVVAGMTTVPLSLLMAGRLLTRRAAALAAGCLVIALLLPFLPGADGGLTEELGDIRRDLVSVAGGNPQASQELREDVNEAGRHLLEPFAAGAAMLTGRAGAFSMLCLLAVWIQASLVGRWNVSMEGLRVVSVNYAVLLAAFLAALAGSRAEMWGGNGYSLATLAILLGLTHARLARVGGNKIST